MDSKARTVETVVKFAEIAVQKYDVSNLYP
jgi:hypothetical protein